MAANVVHNPRPLLAHLVSEEKKRNASLVARYQDILRDLPRGRAYVRKKGDRAYLYLSRRVAGRKYPESKYVGSVHSEQAKKIQQQLRDRARLESELAALEIERRMIEKALHEYRRTR